MNTKLTLRLDEDLIRAAKRYAGNSGKSVSQLVADYFAVIDADLAPADTELTPSRRASCCIPVLAGRISATNPRTPFWTANSLSRRWSADPSPVPCHDGAIM